MSSKENKKFNYRLKNISPSLISVIAQIDECKGRWVSGLNLNPQVLGRLKKSVLITSTGSSTRIEGAKLSDQDIEKMMRGISMQKFVDRDSQEVVGYYELLENIFNSYQNIKFSENIIKSFHKEILKYSTKDKSHRGEYKKQENKVHMINEVGQSVGILFNTTDAYLTPKEMQELVEWTQFSLAQNIFHPLLVIANFLVEFLKIHPFQDGNGRLSRALTNFLLLCQGYLYVPYVSHEKLIEDNKADYYLALRQTQKTFGTKKEDLSTWLDFFLKIFLEQSRQAVGLLEMDDISKILSPKQLIVWNYFFEKEEVSVGDILAHTKIARPTIKQILNVLVKFKKIELIGRGRASRYRRVD